MTKAVVTVSGKLAIREEPSTKSKQVGSLQKGDFVYGSINNGWIGFRRVYRYSGKVENIAGYASTAYTAEVDEVEPEYREVAHVIVVFSNGDISTDEHRLIDAVKDALG